MCVNVSGWVWVCVSGCECMRKCETVCVSV